MLAVEVEKVAVGLTGVALVAADHGFRHFLKMRNHHSVRVTWFDPVVSRLNLFLYNSAYLLNNTVLLNVIHLGLYMLRPVITPLQSLLRPCFWLQLCS